MNYYPFHIGDYVSATRHLSWEEDAAFRRLLDTYYTTEKPIPLDLRAACRLVMAQTDSQREAVRVVLNEFFVSTDAGWVNKRADAEIDAMRDKQQKQREKANTRWDKQRAERGNATASPSDATASQTDADAMPPTPTPTPTPKERTGEIVPAAIAPPPDVEKVVSVHQPTAAGLLCKAIKAAGVDDVNPGHPDLLRLMAAKIPEETFTAAAASLAGRGRGRFALLLRTVEGQWTDAQEAGPVVEAKAADPWATRGGVEGIAKKLGMPRWDECCTFDVYLGRVRKAFEDEQRGSA